MRYPKTGQKLWTAEKHAEEQFTAARTSVIGAMITHDPRRLKTRKRQLMK